MPPMSAPMTQAAMRRMIKESVDAAIAAERERQAKCNPTFFCGIEGAIELRRWFEKIESVFRISKCVEGKKTEMKQLITAEFCPIEEIQRLENELWNLKVKEVKFANLSKAVRMAHKLMEQKSQARNERILEGKKRKWEVNTSTMLLSSICREKLLFTRMRIRRELVEVTKVDLDKKSKEKRLEDVPVIRDFPEVFLEELPGLHSRGYVDVRIDLNDEEHKKHLRIILELLHYPPEALDTKCWLQVITSLQIMMN
ncbi:hypothetical protein Tco_0662621 [Tanacetum coccineum]